MKICSRCGIEKCESEFQVRNASKDGLTASCKKCLSEYDKSRAANQNRVIARELYAKSEHGRAVHAKNSRDWYYRNTEKAKEINEEWKRNNSKKRRVHHLTAYAIRCGVLIKNKCEVCGANRVHAHHDDYNDPLSVRWLCPHHHSMWHSENGEGANAS